MHNIKDIRKNPDLFIENMKNRFIDIDLKKILDLDENNRKLIQEKETLEKEKKDISKKRINHYLKNQNKYQKKFLNIQMSKQLLKMS